MNLINKQHLEWSLKHLEKHGGTDVFPPTHDFYAIRKNWDDVKKYIFALLGSDYVPKSPYTGFSIKNDKTFRAVHELDPIDVIIITAYIYLIWEAIEEARIPKEQGIIYSYRLQPNSEGDFFEGGSENWTIFSNKRAELFYKYKDGFVLKADIADFYNQIYTHRVKNALEECVPDHLRSCCKFIHDWLNNLNSTISKGIPVGPSFSTVLAELILNDIDRRILGYGVEFVRWVDDYFIFSNDAWLLWNRFEDLSRYLYSTHRLVFNGQKTELKSVKDMDTVLEGIEDNFVQQEFNKIKSARCNELFDQIL